MGVTSRAGTKLLISLRDGDVPRALSGPLLASARQHGRGWILSIPGAGETELASLDAVLAAVGKATGVDRLVMVVS